ncbi:4'-phosphopantetheinyl transferase family protein [Streptomyces sp. NPDC058877]|uniref:4'-phosphopantetheinyl transferase family protein n=1 Tax=unclassified Streptomyces TaxID=2593676 RepID=UPI003697D133
MIGALEVADGVWVSAGSARPSTHDGDLRAAAVLPEWRGARFLRGRGLLRSLLHAIAPSLADADIVPDGRGRPCLKDFPHAGISVSHSGSTTACSFTRSGRVGVDLQHSAESAGQVLARRLLRTHAPRVLALGPERAAREVAWVWTAQEACVKAAGTGLAGRPWEIDVVPGSRTGMWGPYRWICLRDHSDIPLSCAYVSYLPGGVPDDGGLCVAVRGGTGVPAGVQDGTAVRPAKTSATPAVLLGPAGSVGRPGDASPSRPGPLSASSRKV